VVSSRKQKTISQRRRRRCDSALASLSLCFMALAGNPLANAVSDGEANDQTDYSFHGEGLRSDHANANARARSKFLTVEPIGAMWKRLAMGPMTAEANCNQRITGLQVHQRNNGLLGPVSAGQSADHARIAWQRITPLGHYSERDIVDAPETWGKDQ
jgi:hypothetical protein